MERWKGKIAVVTGASAGIGLEIVKSLIKHGVNVVGLARRVEIIEKLKEELSEFEAKVHPFKCDVADINEIKRAFAWIADNFGGVDILVNNAGVFKFIRLLDEAASIDDDLKKTVDVNLMGMVYCTREAFKTMKSRDFGYIVNINSIAGHILPFLNDAESSYNIYPASKFGMTATNEIIRQELANSQFKDKIRVTSISPGEVKTEMVAASSYKGDVEQYFAEVPHLLPEDIAEAVIYVLSTPPRCNVTELTIRPTAERA